MNEEENKIEEILGGFLLADIIEIITQEEFDEVKKEIRKLLDKYNNLKEIEEEHRKENGELRKRVAELEENLEDSISKDKVRDKIKEILKESFDGTYEGGELYQAYQAELIRPLQELLEE